MGLKAIERRGQQEQTENQKQWDGAQACETQEQGDKT
jgi:hypothetical protein